MEITTDSNLDNFIKCEPYIELTNGSSITINSDGINLIGATPNTPQPIKFPTLGEWDLYKHHEGCDFGCDGIDALRYAVEDMNKKEGKDMKLLNMYVEKSEENIRKYYKNLIELEKNNDVVQKEYDEVVESYKKAMEELAEKYNEVNSPTGSFIMINPAFGMESRFTVLHKTTEKEEMYHKLCNDELKQLHDKIDEINAQLEMVNMFGDENNCDYDTVQAILVEYGVINENGRLTPYTPTFVNEEAPAKEAPKKAGRPKKVSE